MKRFVIIGKGFGSGLAPERNYPNVLSIGVNNVPLEQYADMIIDMHDLEWTEEECYENYRHLANLYDEETLRKRAKNRKIGFEQILKFAKKKGITLLSIREYEGVPSSIAYPLEEIIAKFDCDLFTSTVPYAIAYGLYKGYDTIELFGINCVEGEEWYYQREAVAHWLGIAKGMGAKVRVNGEKYRVLRSTDPLYGYNRPQEPRGEETEDMYFQHQEKYKNFKGVPDMRDMVLLKCKVWKESEDFDNTIQREEG